MEVHSLHWSLNTRKLTVIIIIYSCCCRSAYAIDHAPTDAGGECYSIAISSTTWKADLGVGLTLRKLDNLIKVEVQFVEI